MSRWNTLCFRFCLYLLSRNWAPLGRAWCHLPCTHPFRHLHTPMKSLKPSPGWRAPHLTASPHRRRAPDPSSPSLCICIIWYKPKHHHHQQQKKRYFETDTEGFKYSSYSSYIGTTWKNLKPLQETTGGKGAL